MNNEITLETVKNYKNIIEKILSLIKMKGEIKKC